MVVHVKTIFMTSLHFTWEKAPTQFPVATAPYEGTCLWQL